VIRRPNELISGLGPLAGSGVLAKLLEHPAGQHRAVEVAVRRRRLGIRAATIVLLLTVVLTTACGEDAEPRTMTVVGTEMAFEAPDTVPAGRYQVTFRNAGLVPHELAFRHPSGEFLNRISIPAHATQEIEVDLEPGTWELGCFEPGHHEAGMHRPLVVDP
jgi:hypothetical protein